MDYQDTKSEPYSPFDVTFHLYSLNASNTVLNHAPVAVKLIVTLITHLTSELYTDDNAGYYGVTAYLNRLRLRL